MRSAISKRRVSDEGENRQGNALTFHPSGSPSSTPHSLSSKTGRMIAELTPTPHIVPICRAAQPVDEATAASS